MDSKMICIECCVEYEYPTGQITDGNLTCLDCMVKAESARRKASLQTSLAISAVVLYVVLAYVALAHLSL